MQLLARVRPGRREVIKLVDHGKPSAAEMLRERAVGIVDLQRPGFAVILVRTFLRAHQLAELTLVL